MRALRTQYLIIWVGGLMVLAAVWAGRKTTRAKTTSHTPELIVCTFLPVYVFTLNVVGDTPDVNVELLVPANLGCPHDYAMRSQDLKKLADADVIVANGLGIDQFVQSLSRSNTHAQVMDLWDGGGDVIREHGDGEVNPHVWVSPRMAIRQVNALAYKLGAIDPARAERYKANANAYIGRLEALGARLQKSAEHFANRNIVTMHDSFDYLARDLNLNVVATLTSDPEHMPSAHQMTETIDTIKRTNAAAIFYEPAYSDRLARSIGADSGVPVYSLNPMTSVEGPISARMYEDVMEQNMAVLQQALGNKP